VPKFQPVQRDIAVIVADTVTYADLMEAVSSADTGGLLRDALLFDVYKPKQTSAGLGTHEKSLAVRLTLASAAATLTDEQIDVAVKAVVDRVASRLGGRLRG
jgi:phenylalanyl-tRNA synthetase beta chain